MTRKTSKDFSGRDPLGNELRVWFAYTRGVIGLRGKKPDAPDRDMVDGSIETETETKITVTPRFTKSGSDSRPAGLDRSTAQKLRKGKIPIDRRLDLHGMNQPAAFETLRKTLQESFACGQRLVLVITGKGRSTEDTGEHWTAREHGVLKRMLPEWLNSPPLDKIVIEYVPARREHGGDGAFYVLLKRDRNLSPSSGRHFSL